MAENSFKDSYANLNARVLDALQADSVEIANTFIPEFEKRQKDFEFASGVAKSAVQEGAAAAQQVKANEGQLKLQLEDRLAKQQEVMLPDELNYQLGEQLRQATVDTASSLKRVQELQSVSFFDNPVQYLVSSLQTPEAMTKFAQSKQTVDVLSEARNKLANSLTTSAQAIKATARSTNEAALAGELQGIASQAAFKSAQLDQQVAQEGMQYVSQRMQLSRAQREPLEAAANRALQSEQLAMQRESHALHKQQVKAQMEKAKQDDDAIMAQTAVVAAAATRDGNPAYAELITTVKNPSQLRALLAASPKTKALYDTYFDRGLDYQNLGYATFGQSPLEALYRADANSLPRTSAQQEAFNQIRNAVAREQATPEYKALPTKEAKLARDEAAARGALTDYKLAPPPAATVIPETPLARVLGVKNDSLVGGDWGRLYSAAMAAIADGKISATQAASDLTYMAAAANNVRAETVQYSTFGVDAPTSLIVPVATGTGKNNAATKTVNLLDPVATLEAMILKQRQGVLGKLFEAAPAAFGRAAVQEQIARREAQRQESEDALNAMRELRNQGVNVTQRVVDIAQEDERNRNKGAK